MILTEALMKKVTGTIQQAARFLAALGMTGGATLVVIAGSALLIALKAIAPANAVAPGDVDCNGVVTSVDASLVLQFTAGRITSLACAGDVNGDGGTNSIDSLFILQYVAGLISAFPSCDVTAAPPSAQDELDAASSGTTICLQDGTYDRLFVNQKSDITITGLGPDRTKVSDNPDHHTCLLVLNSQDITIRGVSAQDCTVQAAFAGDSTNVVFSDVETARGPIGFQYQRSSGRIDDSHAHDHNDFGAIVQINSDVTIENTVLENNNFGILSQDNTTMHASDDVVSGNRQGGVYTLKQTGTTTIAGSTIAGNALNIFTGVPGCANLPAGDPDPPQCFLDNPDAYRSQIAFAMSDTTVSNSGGTGVVIFPGVTAILQGNTISGSQLTGMFAWGAHVSASGDDFGSNVENAIECRAYPDPQTGDRGMCDLSNEHIHDSLPLPGGSLGGGFVSEGGAFSLTGSTIENNYNIGVQVLHGGTGTIASNTIRNNGGTAFCISGAGAVDVHDNTESGNLAGTCGEHP
jgi:hypothetical protein